MTPRMRPCGACRSLVPAHEGCDHWQPGRSAKAADSAARRLAKRERKEVNEPKPARYTQAWVDAIPVRRRVRTREAMDRNNEKQRERRQQEREKSPKTRPHRQLASDAERVAEFARIMGRNYR